MSLKRRYRRLRRRVRHLNWKLRFWFKWEVYRPARKVARDYLQRRAERKALWAENSLLAIASEVIRLPDPRCVDLMKRGLCQEHLTCVKTSAILRLLGLEGTVKDLLSEVTGESPDHFSFDEEVLVLVKRILRARGVEEVRRIVDQNPQRWLPSTSGGGEG